MLEIFKEAMLDESKSEERTIKSNLRVLLIHMLKCKYQNEYKDKSSWIASIVDSQADMINEFKDIGKGSLYKKFYLRELPLQTIYNQAVVKASIETGLDINCFPATCEWTKEQLVSTDFIMKFIQEFGR